MGIEKVGLSLGKGKIFGTMEKLIKTLNKEEPEIVGC